MQKPIGSITDEDLQLYLFGELRGKKREIVQSIDRMIELETLSENEKDLKARLQRLREIDEFLIEASKASFPMPQELENKLVLAFEGEKKQKAKENWSISHLVGRLKNSFDLGSLVSGAAVASILTIVFLQGNPNFLLDVTEQDQLKISYFNATQELEQLDAKHRGALDRISDLEQAQVDYRNALSRLEVKSNAPFSSVSTKMITDEPMLETWAVLKTFAAQILVHGDGGWALLNEGDKVKIGQQYSIKVLPLSDSKIDINYYRNDGSVIRLVSDLIVNTGQSVSFPETTGMTDQNLFVEPTGIHQISILANGEETLSYSFLVE